MEPGLFRLLAVAVSIGAGAPGKAPGKARASRCTGDVVPAGRDVIPGIQAYRRDRAGAQAGFVDTIRTRSLIGPVRPCRGKFAGQKSGAEPHPRSVAGVSKHAQRALAVSADPKRPFLKWMIGWTVERKDGGHIQFMRQIGKNAFCISVKRFGQAIAVFGRPDKVFPEPGTRTADKIQRACRLA